MSTVPPRRGADHGGATMLAAVGARWAQIAVTYVVTLVENTFELMYPWAIGLAVDGLLDGRGAAALLPLLVMAGAHVLVGAGRHLYDTRLFAGIYAEVATATVLRQRRAGIGTAEIAARAIMAREFVDFFEREVPAMTTIAIGLVGGVAMLFVYDLQAGLTMAGLLLPVYAVNSIFGRRAATLNRGLNDEAEREVNVIAAGTPQTVAAHFRAVARWRVRLSDAEALTWSLVELLAIGAVLLVLLRATDLPGVGAGEIYAVLSYALRVLESLDEVPLIVQQVGRLLDIRRRIEGGQPATITPT